MTTVHDVAIIGGGPAGAHAAWKAALLFRKAILFDKGRRFSRIYWSPRVANIPGASGISGRDLVARGYDDIKAFEEEQGRSFVEVHEDTAVTTVQRDGDLFTITATHKDTPATYKAKAVVLATGCIDGQPRLRDFRKRDIEAILPYANKGMADYCLLCDGHTVDGKRVAVLGCGPSAAGIAASLKKNFNADTAIVAACNLGHPQAEEHTQDHWDAIEKRLESRDIPVITGEITGFTGIRDGHFGIEFSDGRVEEFDKAWISMGWYKVNNEQAIALGGATDDDGFVRTDRDGRMLDGDNKPVPGVYVVGDLVSDSWKQIPIAWGEAESAVVDVFVRS